MSAGSRDRREVPAPGQMYLWLLHTDEMTDAATACGVQEILAAGEKNEARRFPGTTARQQFVIARALVRLALSQHFAIPARDWRFDRDHNRKPFIAAPSISPSVRFSVSHTQGLMACLITLSAKAAVDVEKIEHHPDLEIVSRDILSSAEQKTLSALSGEDWTRRFFDHWTLKEAYAKARGLGLSLTLSDIGFDLDNGNTIRPHFSSQMEDDPSAWVFWQRHFSSQHTVSVAAKNEGGERFEIILRLVKLDGPRIAIAA